MSSHRICTYYMPIYLRFKAGMLDNSGELHEANGFLGILVEAHNRKELLNLSYPK